jgi:hypothetical protein
MKKILFTLCLAIVATMFAFGQGTFSLVVKPIGGCDPAKGIDENWDVQSALTDPKYAMTYVTTVDGDELYQCTMTLPAYCKANKWESKFGDNYAAGENIWTKTHQFLIVYENEFATNGGAVSNTVARTFIVQEDGTTVTFYARVRNSDGKIRMVCDAQQLKFAYQSGNVTIALFDVAIGEPKASTIGRVEFFKDNSSSIMVCTTNNINEDLGGTFSPSVFASYEYSAVVVDFQTLSFTVKKVLDGFETPLVQIGDETPAPIEDSFVSGVYSTTNPLTIGGTVAGFIKAYQWEKGTRATSIANLNDVTVKLNYEIIPDAATSGEVNSILLTTSATSLSCNNWAVPTSATWVASNTDISAGLANGTYTLKVWYTAEAYGTTLFEDYTITTGNGSGAKYYTTTFTVKNPIIWGDSESWSRGGGAPTEDDDVIIPVVSNGIYPTIPDETTVKTITFEYGAEVNLLGSLNAEAIKVDYKITGGQWYSIGFPFAIGNVYSNKYKASLTEDNGGSGNFWLRTYDGEDFVSASTIESGKGYIIQFPVEFGEDWITFTSDGGITLNNNGSITGSDNHQLLANPALKKYLLSDNTSNYYVLSEDGTKFLLNGAESILPFEAVIKLPKQQSAPSFISTEERSVTAIGVPTTVSDPVIATHYYTLQGTEIQQPIENGVFIVKKVHASQTVETAKIINIKK